MAKIQGIQIKNFRALKDITMGRLWNNSKTEPLSDLTVVIGKNGAGKSTLFDAFCFLSDCLKSNVEDACDARGRGGFHRIRSQGSKEPLEFQVYFKEERTSRPITYELVIDTDHHGRPYVKRERLRQRRQGQKHGWPFSFLMLNEGDGIAWKGEYSNKELSREKDNEFNFMADLFKDTDKKSKFEESGETELVQLDDKRKLGIATLGSLRQHPRVSAFRRFIEGWYLSYFNPDSARELPMAGPQKHLNSHGDNIGNVVQFMEREHKDRLKKILGNISGKIPGIQNIDTIKSPDGRLLLRFYEKGFNDPFFAQQMSDGTLKVFAYLLMLEDPSPNPFICIEEPENGVYHKLLEILASEFRTHANIRKNSPQIFITTHQPYFVNALKPEEVWVLQKNDDGFCTIERADQNPLIKSLTDQELPLGGLWYSDYLDRR